MKKIVWVEGITVLLISLVSITESTRLLVYKSAEVLFDPMGPGFYVLILSIPLMILGLLHIHSDLKKSYESERLSTSREMKTKKIIIILVLTIYIFLIRLLGYFIASIAFFFVMFKILGRKPLTANILLALICAVCFYVLFVHFGRVVFPRPYIQLL